MRSRIALTLLASLTLTAGGLAACGDDDDAAEDTVPAAVTTAPAAETTEAAADTTEAAADTTEAAADTTEAATDTTEAAADTTAAATDTTAATEGTGLELAIAETDLGPVVADAEGSVLYIYTPDTGTTSTCEGGCAEAWPPAVSVGAPTAGEGIDAADIATTTRSNGDTQVTYYGHPLYYFASDLAPGDTTGQGVGGVWFVIDAEGNQIEG